MISVAELFLELSGDKLLQQKLLSSSCFEEDNFDKISILLKTLFIFIKGLQHDCNEAKSTLSSNFKKLASLCGELCQECSEKSRSIFYGESEKEDLPKTDSQSVLSNLVSNERKCDSKGSALRSKIYSSPRKPRAQSDFVSSPKEREKCGIDSVLQPNVVKLTSTEDVKRDTDHFGCHKILAQETQELKDILASRMPIDGRTSIPETMAMDFCESSENSLADDSCDIFDDGSEGATDASEMCTVLHTSPVLGKSASNRNSPIPSHHLRSHSLASSPLNKKYRKASSVETSLFSQILGDAKELKNESTQSPKKLTSRKSFSVAGSPKCDSEIENSPSLLQLKPLRNAGVGGFVSHSSKPPSLVDICSSSESSQIAQIYESEHCQNFNTAAQASSNHNSVQSASTNFVSKCTVKLSSKLSSCENSKALSHESRVKRNLSDEYSNKDVKTQNSFTKNKIPLCTDVPSSIPDDEFSSETLTASNIASAQQKATRATSSSFANVSLKTSNARKPSETVDSEKQSSSPSNARKQSGSVDSKKPSSSKASLGECLLPEASSSAALNRTHQDGNLLSRTSSRLSLAKRSATDVSSAATAFRGSLLKWDLAPKSVQATVKKNVKQTKLSQESFVVSKAKGNLEDDDPLLAEAKARSLATKAIDDRKRLQLQHPALRQLSSVQPSVEQERCPSPDNYQASKRRSRESAPNETQRKKCRSEFQPAPSITAPSSSPDVTSASLITESQVMKCLLDSPGGLSRVDVPEAGESLRSPSKNSPPPKKGAVRSSRFNKSTTPRKPAADESSSRKFSFRNQPSTSCSPSKKVTSPRKMSACKSPSKKSRESPRKCPSLKTGSPFKTGKTKDRGTKHNPIIDDSFDRVPGLENSPAFAHAGAVERKKSRRLQLPGWSCRLCQQYYEGRQLSTEQLLEYMNRCSKHRSKHKPIINTPENFWKPDMSGSEDDD